MTWKERTQPHRFSSKEFESRLRSEIPTCFFDENFGETCCSLNSRVITDETVLRADRATLGLGDGGYWLSYPIKAFGQDEYLPEIDVTASFWATSRENAIEICRLILMAIRISPYACEGGGEFPEAGDKASGSMKPFRS